MWLERSNGRPGEATRHFEPFLLQISARPRETKRRPKKPEISDGEARKPPETLGTAKITAKKRTTKRPADKLDPLKSFDLDRFPPTKFAVFFSKVVRASRGGW